jgi:acyl carrier protein
VHEAILQNLGAIYVPDEVISIETLGLTDFPKTISGKIKKSVLTRLVREYRSSKSNNFHLMGPETSVHRALRKAYHKSTAIPEEMLDLELPVTNFADSITFMRIRHYLRKELGFTMSTQQMTEFPTIKSQIELLQKLNHGQISISSNLPRLGDTQDLEELSITNGSLENAEDLIRIAKETLHTQGFNGPNDVASIIPTYDYMQMLLDSGIINSWNFGISIMADGSTTKVSILEYLSFKFLA